eukprot:m.444785 g.444785  ORF g.444785 m.444785 type:complete len:176 (+) comp19148_c0_seq1:4931-5458(+)
MILLLCVFWRLEQIYMFSEVYGSVKQQVALTGTNTIVVLGDCTVVKLVPLIIEGTSAVRCIMTTAKVSNVIGYGKETIPRMPCCLSVTMLSHVQVFKRKFNVRVKFGPEGTLKVKSFEMNNKHSGKFPDLNGLFCISVTLALRTMPFVASRQNFSPRKGLQALLDRHCLSPYKRK